jgi:hypothetical protein
VHRARLHGQTMIEARAPGRSAADNLAGVTRRRRQRHGLVAAANTSEQLRPLVGVTHRPADR